MPKNKLNDKVKKNKGLKEEKYVSEDALEIRRFAFILVGVIVVILIVYGLTIVFKKDKESDTTREVTTGAINYSVASVGTMLNKEDSEYYVILYDNENTNAVYYSTLVGMYSSNDKSLNIYYCDLGNALNNKYYVGENGTSNPKATSIDDFAFGELTLIKVKNGRVTKYLETIDTIKTELGL